MTATTSFPPVRRGSSGPLVLVTAAAGNTGFPAALRLAERGYAIRALVRRDSLRAQRLRAAGVQVVTGSLDDVDDVRRALDAVQRAYFCAPLLPGLLSKTALFAAAAEDAGVEFVVSISQWLADPAHPSLHTRESWLAERLLDRVPGVAHTALVPGWFADNYFAAPDLVTQFGVLPLPLGEGLNAPPSNEDLGAVAAAVLADPGRHAGRRYRPTGPELLTPQQIADACRAVTGRRVRYVDTPPALFARLGRVIGLPDYTTVQVVHYLADYRRNAFGDGAPTDVVPDLTGRPAEPFRDIAARQLAGSARRTVRSRAAALARMTRGMLRGVPNLDVLVRAGDHAVPHARLAADSSEWRHSRPATSPSTGLPGQGWA